MICHDESNQPESDRRGSRRKSLTESLLVELDAHSHSLYTIYNKQDGQGKVFQSYGCL
jgi:hypothetical protein